MSAYKILAPDDKPMTSGQLFAFWDLCEEHGVNTTYGILAENRKWSGAFGEQSQIDELIEGLNERWPGWRFEKDPPGAAGW